MAPVLEQQTRYMYQELQRVQTGGNAGNGGATGSSGSSDASLQQQLAAERQARLELSKRVETLEAQLRRVLEGR